MVETARMAPRTINPIQMTDRNEVRANSNLPVRRGREGHAGVSVSFIDTSIGKL